MKQRVYFIKSAVFCFNSKRLATASKLSHPPKIATFSLYPLEDSKHHKAWLSTMAAQETPQSKTTIIILVPNK
jgi:hypothetical protein